jgi:hypothetical protein
VSALPREFGLMCGRLSNRLGNQDQGELRSRASAGSGVFGGRLLSPNSDQTAEIEGATEQVTHGLRKNHIRLDFFFG